MVNVLATAPHQFTCKLRARSTAFENLFALPTEPLTASDEAKRDRVADRLAARVTDRNGSLARAKPCAGLAEATTEVWCLRLQKSRHLGWRLF
jgi:hypothetical protein